MSDILVTIQLVVLIVGSVGIGVATWKLRKASEDLAETLEDINERADDGN